MRSKEDEKLALFHGTVKVNLISYIECFTWNSKSKKYTVKSRGLNLDFDFGVFSDF
jgi:hypothetical protein